MSEPISDHTVPWPDDIAAGYVAKGYWAGAPLGTLFRQVAGQPGQASRLALADPVAGIRLSYGELAGRADAAAARLLRLGLNQGDRIVVQLGNGWEFVVLTLACLRAGLVPVMALPAHRRSELGYLARHAQATAIAVPGTLRGFDHQSLAHELADEVSGVTGGPWHVLAASEEIAPGSVDLRALCGPDDDPEASRRRLDAVRLSSRDVAVFLLSGGTTGRPKLIARTHDDYAYNARRSAEVAALDSGSCYLVAVPAGHNFPLACPGILGTLLSGGQVVMLPSPEPARAFAVMAAEGITHTPRGYYKAAEQNARAFTSDGWYRSGDICRRGPGGNLIVEGRDKDMINRGGEKISAEEVENLVYQLSAVAAVAAVAMPDPDFGERVCVYVVPRPGQSLTLAEIRASMEAAEVARFKFPERLELVPELPATKVGKIDKKALRADIAGRLGQDAGLSRLRPGCR